MNSHPPSAAEAIATLVKEIDRLRTENATLRELVREALKHDVCSMEWNERAEKALATTSPPPR